MSIDYVLLWLLTIANSFALLLVIRQLAGFTAYRSVKGPRSGATFADWILQTPEGKPRSSVEMPAEYTMLFAAESCGPCHTLVEELAQRGRGAGTLVAAVEGDPSRLQQAGLTPRGSLFDELLVGADHEFRKRFGVPGTPFAVAVRREHVIASGPARTPMELQSVRDELRPAGAVVP